MIDFASLKRLQVRATEAAGVWRIVLPARPWRFAGAQRERQSLVETLSADLPFRVLWLSPWASEERAGWRHLAAGEPFSSLEGELAGGAWAALFFERDPGASFDAALVPAFPADAAAAAQALLRFGADAAIWSWYDDKEWLVAVSSRRECPAL